MTSADHGAVTSPLLGGVSQVEMACAQVAGQRLRGGLGLGVESAEQRQKTKDVDVGCCRRVEQAIQGVFGLGAERRGEEEA
jgi:hypothetical protein